MLCKPVDPEQPKPLAHIWRPIYCMGYMQRDDQYWGLRDQQVMDANYCLDRYSLIDAPPRRLNHESI